MCDDPTDPKDCSGRGICENTDTDSGYTCYCEPGYNGDNCEESNKKLIYQCKISF